MKAITVRQPWASLIAAGVKTIETRSRPTRYRGRIAIHAGLHRPRNGMQVGEWTVKHWDTRTWAYNRSGYRLTLPLGAVVASAVLTGCVPIIGDEVVRGPSIRQKDERLWGWFGRDYFAMGPNDITDQLPFGDFSPGRWALLLDDIAPTTDRCPACWGRPLPADQRSFAAPCDVCERAGRCDPVPARGHQAVPWEWTP